MPNKTIPGQTVGQLRDELHGTVLTPDDEGYDEARQLWNARIDSHDHCVRNHEARFIRRAGGVGCHLVWVCRRIIGYAVSFC